MSSSVFSTEGEVTVLTAVDEGRASGEPLKAQHLMIDFTPQKDDEGEIGKKCLEFWAFVQKRLELKSLLVEPEAEYKLQSSEDEDPSRMKSPLTIGRESVETFPALDAISKLEEKGALKTALWTNLN